MFCPYNNNQIAQLDITLTGHQGTQKYADGMLLNYMQSSVV